jgi:hypothetical protein
MPKGAKLVSTYCVIITTRLRPTPNLHTGIADNNTKFDIKN